MATNTAYHIGRNGKVAKCKAQPGACPLGGEHFANKAIADFYVETRVDLASPQSVQTILQQMPDVWLNQRIEETSFLNYLQGNGRTREARAQERKMRKMFNGYTPEDKTWDEATLRDEKFRRTKVDEEREWAAIISGHKAVANMETKRIEMRLQKLQPLRNAIDSGDHEAARRYKSMLEAKYNFRAEDQSWNPMVLEGELAARQAAAPAKSVQTASWITTRWAGKNLTAQRDAEGLYTIVSENGYHVASRAALLEGNPEQALRSWLVDNVPEHSGAAHTIY